MTHKKTPNVTHPQSIFMMLHILSILTDHIMNQSIHYNKESSDWCLHHPKEHKEEWDLRENWLKVCYLLHIIHPQSIFSIFLITFLNSDIDLLDLTKLGNLFQIKDPRKCTESVPCKWNEKYWTLSQVI